MQLISKYSEHFYEIQLFVSSCSIDWDDCNSLKLHLLEAHFEEVY